MIVDMRTESSQGNWEYKLHRVAWFPNYSLGMLSVAGSSTAIKALNAAFYQPHIRTSLASSGLGFKGVSLLDDYHIRVAKIGFGMYQLAASVRMDGLIPCVSDSGLWAVLTGAQYSTPVLREWLPWIRQELKARDLLAELNSYNCDPAFVRATKEELDDIVSMGVQSGQLKIGGER